MTYGSSPTWVGELRISMKPTWSSRGFRRVNIKMHEGWSWRWLIQEAPSCMVFEWATNFWHQDLAVRENKSKSDTDNSTCLVWRSTFRKRKQYTRKVQGNSPARVRWHSDFSSLRFLSPSILSSFLKAQQRLPTDSPLCYLPFVIHTHEYRGGKYLTRVDITVGKVNGNASKIDTRIIQGQTTMSK